MDFIVKQEFRTRGVMLLSFAIIVMMAALVAHAGAMDMASVQITQGRYCHWWCNEYICVWTCP
jgi:hypothetical protein